MDRRIFLKQLSKAVALSCCGSFMKAGKLYAQTIEQIKVWSESKGAYIMTTTIEKSEQEWRRILTPEQFEVTRKHGTERAFSGAYDKHHEAGVYQCVCCGQDLFHADHKYDSGTGWPSFFTTITGVFGTSTDYKMILPRTEYHCIRCGGHHGHVFDDGPRPTGKRWCNNGIALKFIPKSGKV